MTSRFPVGWSDAVRGYSHFMTASGCSTRTLDLRLYWLRRIAAATDNPADITRCHIVELMGRPDLSPATRASIRASARTFFAWALTEGIVKVDPSVDLPNVRVPRGTPKPVDRQLLAEAMGRAHPHVKLMMLLACLAGLRAAEIANLHTDEIVDGSLWIVGKGGKRRRIPLHPVLAQELAGIKGWVFPSPYSDGPIRPGSVSQAVRDAFGGRASVHQLRHLFASDAYLAGGDILAVRDLLGHSSVATTQIYTATPDDALERAVAGLTPPTDPITPPPATTPPERHLWPVRAVSA